jgi:hypothetical protein
VDTGPLALVDSEALALRSTGGILRLISGPADSALRPRASEDPPPSSPLKRKQTWGWQSKPHIRKRAAPRKQRGLGQLPQKQVRFLSCPQATGLTDGGGRRAAGGGRRAAGGVGRGGSGARGAQKSCAPGGGGAGRSKNFGGAA